MSGIKVKCVRGDGDMEASPITDRMIVSVDMAKQRGKRFLDDPRQGAYYLTTNRKFTVPHKGSTVVPGTWIRVTISRLNIHNALMKVKSYNLAIGPRGVWASIEAEEYREFDIY